MAGRIQFATGVDVSGFTHTVDESALRHTRRRQGPTGTADRTVSDAYYDRLPEIVGAPDDVRLSQPDPHRPERLRALEFRKRYGGDWLVVIEVRTGRKQLALLSMRKEKAAGA